MSRNNSVNNLESRTSVRNDDIMNVIGKLVARLFRFIIEINYLTFTDPNFTPKKRSKKKGKRNSQSISRCQLRLSDISNVSTKKSRVAPESRQALSTGDSSGWSEFSGIIGANALPPIRLNKNQFHTCLNSR